MPNLTLIGALVVTHAMLRHLTSWRCIIIIIINFQLTIDPQAAAVSRIRRRIFVRRISAEKYFRRLLTYQLSRCFLLLGWWRTASDLAFQQNACTVSALCMTITRICFVNDY